MRAWLGFFCGTGPRFLTSIGVLFLIGIIATFWPQVILTPIHSLIGVIAAILAQVLNCLLPVAILGAIMVIAFRIITGRR